MSWLGLDLGGTLVKAGVVDHTGRILSQATVPSAEAAGTDAWTQAGLEAARTAVAALPVGTEPPRAVGLAVPGAVDPRRAVLVDLVARLDAGNGIDLKAAFADLALPVVADNDARAALVGERRWGAAAGIDDVVLITLGTGMGGAALVDGVAPGADRVLAGNQIGHFTVDLDGALCVCGNRGCAETIASARGLVRLATEAGLDAPDAAAVFNAALAGDDLAQGLVDRFTAALTAAIVTAIHAYQPDLVLLAGGMMRASAQFFDTVVDAVDQRAWTLPRGRVRVAPAILGDHAGIVGAAALAMQRHP